MPSTPTDPWLYTDRVLWRSATVGLLVFGAVVAVPVLGWALTTLPVQVSDPPPPPPPPTVTEAGVGIDTAAWQVQLWQPLRDAPAVVAERPPPPPLEITLFAISQSGTQPRATFDHPQQGLFHLRPGESAHGLTLERIEGKRAHVLWDGEARVLEFSHE